MPHIQVGLDQVPQLGHIFPLAGNHILQADDPLGKHMEVAEVFIPEEVVLVFLQLLAEVDQLFIVDPQVQEIAPDVVHLGGIAFDLAPQDGFLQLVQPVLRLFQQGQVLPDGGFQQVIQEALQPGQLPFLRAGDGLDQLLRVSAVVHQDDAFFIQCEGEGMARAADIRPVRNGKGAREGILVHDGLCFLRRNGFHVHIDEHVKAVPALLPLFRGQHSHILDAALGKILGLAGGQGLFDQVIHMINSAFQIAFPAPKDITKPPGMPVQ